MAAWMCFRWVGVLDGGLEITCVLGLFDCTRRRFLPVQIHPVIPYTQPLAWRHYACDVGASQSAWIPKELLQSIQNGDEMRALQLNSTKHHETLKQRPREKFLT